ncbi:MAG TPA: universal stress protein [Bacteroidales bacterium]|nr:universal stress protein [Bacteroidales bacterium]
MDSQKHIILVPTDFSEFGDYALEHAVKFSKLLGKEIAMIHVIKLEEERLDAEQKIKEKANEISQKFQIMPKTMVREGSIFSTIGDVANELNASMVIMGTHGRKGMQKFSGSWALKVVVKSKAPCIVVQGPPHKDTFEKIVFPVDYKREMLEKIGWLTFIAKVFNSKVYIYKSSSKVKFLGIIRFNDKGFLRKIFSNTKLTEKHLKNNDIPYELISSEPRKDFSEQTIHFAESIGADLILISTTKSINLADYIFAASEQNIIDNHAKIPVMCINPKPSRLGGSFSASGA